MSSSLSQLRKCSVIVSDSGLFKGTWSFASSVEIHKYNPTDATTNPSLILAAAKLPEYKEFLAQSISRARGASKAGRDVLLEVIVDFGVEVLKVVPGRVSTEVDASYQLHSNDRLSYDTQGTIDEALKIIDLYAQRGVGKDRILVKIPSTWEGIRRFNLLGALGIEAAKVLENDHRIHCNMTLMFNLKQVGYEFI